MSYNRKTIVGIMQAWAQQNAGGAAHKEIVSLYNSFKPLPRGYAIKMSDAWCAATWSAAAIKAGYTGIMPIECSCPNLIMLAKGMGIWVEDDSYVPSPGDGVLYDWQDSGKGDNTGTPDHIGIVETVDAAKGTFTVIEGNKPRQVGRRSMKVNGRYIRGFICPRYSAVEPSSTVAPTDNKATDLSTVAAAVINGDYGNGDTRTAKLKAAGYDPVTVQAEVNKILKAKTAAASTAKTEQYKVNAVSGLNIRDAVAGRIVVAIPYNHVVTATGKTGKDSAGDLWRQITTTYGAIKYTGYCKAVFLSKI